MAEQPLRSAGPVA